MNYTKNLILSLCMISISQVLVSKPRKYLRIPSAKSSVERFRASSALYNHFAIDDRTAPGRVWNEEFTSGVR